ncbi:MAG: hypothetical protein MUD08_16135, partial [Cytophagales bacterium]|nr:hypothetical protein [Cytophagales bacterium]
THSLYPCVAYHVHPARRLPSQQQFGLALLMICGGCLFLLLAFAVFLPVLIVAPAKFAISFTLGCALVMAGVSCLRGWQQQLGHMFSKERLPFTAGEGGRWGEASSANG